MKEKSNALKRLADLVKHMEIDMNAKYLSARQAETVYGISSKTILNRSNLPPSHRRYIPSARLKGGRKKYFERKVLERLIICTESSQ